jgi:hypothetical protein
MTFVARQVLRLVAGLAVVLALASPARAEGEGGSDADKEARRLFQKAELSFNVGKFAEALTDYQAAYEVKPLNGFLFNIAQCYRNLGDYERARFFFRRYLTLEPKSPNRRRVEALIDEMNKKLEEKAAAAAATAATAPPTGATTSPPAEGDTPKPAEAKPVEPAPAAATPSPPPAAPKPADQGATPALVAEAGQPEQESPGVWTRWWFWTGVGAVVVGGAVAAFFLTRPQTKAPGTLDPIDGR